MRFTPFPSLRLLTILQLVVLIIAGLGPATGAWAIQAVEPDAESGQKDYVEYQVGTLPIILTAPHGGRETPDNVADRKEGSLKIDMNSQELAREINAELKRRTGQEPAMIINLLHRSKLDPNREIVEAAQGDPNATKGWQRFQACVDAAKTRSFQAHRFAFLIDVHGHAHAIKRIELGYGLSRADINKEDAQLDASNAARRSTFANLSARSGKNISELIRGPESFGALLSRSGYPVIPSPADPRPFDNDYYSGSYIVRHHTSKDFPGVDGLQLECCYEGQRDTADNRAKLARAVVDALKIFLEDNYGYELPQ